MKRIIACIVVLVSVLVTSPAQGQTSRTGWTSGTSPGYNVTPELRVVESAGEVEVRFTSNGPGRFVYNTHNGDCHGYPTPEDPANETPVSPDECGRPFARASEDYVAVRGEWTFTEPGSRTVRIPIIDDDLDETDGEAFTIWAGEADNLGSKTDGVYGSGACCYNLYIYIGDDDPKEDGEPEDSARPGDQHAAASVEGTTVVTRVDQAPTAASVVETASPPRDLEVHLPSEERDLEVALPSEELEPGPGFELVSGQHSEIARARDERGGGSAAWWAMGLGATALGSAAGVVWLRRQRRWSPTRP